MTVQRCLRTPPGSATPSRIYLKSFIRVPIRVECVGKDVDFTQVKSAAPHYEVGSWGKKVHIRALVSSPKLICAPKLE